MSESVQSPGAVSLDQFIALNDELTALVRAGVPLERGLIEAGRDLRGRLGVLSTEVGERMGRGMRLPEAIAASGSGMPDVYRAVLEAGLRSGRLTEALEGMAAIARGYAEARRAVGMALLYPLIVAGLAYSLGVFFLTQVIPRFITALKELQLAPIGALNFLGRMGETALYWGPIPPILLALAAWRWAWTGRSVVLDTGGLGPLLNKVPLIGSMIGSYRAAGFAGLLALLIEHRVPLDEAVRLAGETSTDPKFRDAAGRFADSIRRGSVADEAPASASKSFPPLLSWMLTAGHRQGNLPQALGQLAQTYRLKARGRADALKLTLPSVCLLWIGVSAVLIYAFMLFIPLLKIYDELALPISR